MVNRTQIGIVVTWEKFDQKLREVSLVNMKKNTECFKKMFNIDLLNLICS